MDDDTTMRRGVAMLAGRRLERFRCATCDEETAGAALVIAGEVAVCVGCVAELVAEMHDEAA